MLDECSEYTCMLSSCMIDADGPFPYFFSEVMVLDVRCLVLGLILGTFAISIAPALS